MQSVLLGMDAEEEEEVAPVMPVFSGPRKKAKPSKPVRKWEAVSYVNKEGPGSLQLMHVRPVNDPNRAHNTFLRLDKKAQIFTYTDAQYEASLNSADWSREETDRLIELAIQFDGRLLLVADRWIDFAGKKRDLEDLKARFYFIQNALNPTEFRFDAEGAKRRKRHFEILYNRSGHEVWEEFELKKKHAPIAEELQRAQSVATRTRALQNALQTGVKDYLAARTKSDPESSGKLRTSWRDSLEDHEDHAAVVAEENGEDWADSSGKKSRKPSSAKKKDALKGKSADASQASVASMQAAVRMSEGEHDVSLCSSEGRLRAGRCRARGAQGSKQALQECQIPGFTCRIAKPNHGLT